MRAEFRLAWSYLLRRRGRSVLTAVSIALGVLLLFSLNSLSPIMFEVFKKGAEQPLSGVDLSIKSAAGGLFGTSTFLASISRESGNMAEVQDLAFSLERTIVLPDSLSLTTKRGDKLTSLKLVGCQGDGYAAIHKIKVEEGSWLDPKERRGIVLSRSLSQAFGLNPGSWLSLPGAKGVSRLRVMGILPDDLRLGNKDVYCALEAAQDLLGVGEQASLAEFRLKRSDTASALRQSFLIALGPGYASNDESHAESSEFASILSLSKGIFNGMGGLALFLGAFIVFMTFRMLVAERRRDIGLLRSVGFTKRAVTMSLIFESLILGFLGSISGIAMGWAFLKLVLFGIKGIWNEFFRVSLPNPAFNLGLAAFALALGCLTAIAGALIPALRSETLEVLEALRPQEAKAKGFSKPRVIIGILGLVLCLPGFFSSAAPLTGLGFLGFWIALTLLGPLAIGPLARVFAKLSGLFRPSESDIAARNLERSCRRAASISLSLCVGLSILVSAGTLVQSMRVMMEDYVDTSLGSDYVIMPSSLLLSSGNSGTDQGFIQRVRSIEGVAIATSIQMSSARLSFGIGTPQTTQVLGIEAALYPKVSGLSFISGSKSDFDLLERGLNGQDSLIVNGILASQIGVKRGDIIELIGPNGKAPYKVAAIANDFLNVKIASVFLDKSRFERDFGMAPGMLSFISAKKGHDGQALERQLRIICSDYPALKLSSGREIKQLLLSQMEPALLSLYFLLGVFSIPAIIALVNGLSVSVLERTREIGVMRAIGALKAQVAAIVRLESALLCAYSFALSVFGGILLGRLLIMGTSAKGFTLSFFFPWEGIFIALIGSVLIAVLGSWGPTKYAKKIKITEALRFE